MRKGLICIVALFICALLLAPAGGSAEPERALTLMIYMCGSNLESEGGAGTQDLYEMVGSGVDTEEVNILTMTGGSWFWMTGQDPRNTWITRQNGTKTEVQWVGDAMNMGNAATLSKFITWSVQNYPARKYALILWDHGGGPLGGVCVDEVNENDRLMPDEIVSAIRGSALPGRLSWIGFDACLMGSLEVATALAPYAEYMIASQETEPADGWDYSFLRGIEKDPDGGETGKRIVDAYFRGMQNRNGMTLSCLKLSAAERAAAAMGDFFEPIGRSLEADVFNHLSRMRVRSTSFGRAVRESSTSSYDLVDVYDLLNHCKGLGDTDRVLDALNELVVYSRTGNSNAGGVSVYHPIYNKLNYQYLWGDLYGLLHFNDGYQRYVRNFGNMLTGRQLADWSRIRLQDEGPEGKNGNRFSLQLDEEQAQCLSSAHLIVLAMVDRTYNGGTDIQLTEAGVSQDRFATAYYPVATAGVSLSDDGKLSGVFTGSSLYVTDEVGQPIAGPVGYELSEDGTMLYLSAYYTDNSGREDAKAPAKVILACTKDASSDRVWVKDFYVYDKVTETYTTRVPFSEENYTDLWISRMSRNYSETGGTLPGFNQWENASTWDVALQLPMKWRLRFLNEQLSGTPLYATIQITDTQQNTFCTPLTRVQNPNLQSLEVMPRTQRGPDFELTVYTVLDTSELNPGLSIGAELRNTSGEARTFELDTMVFNGVRSVIGDRDYIYFGKLEPGESKYAACRIDSASLAGLGSLDEIAFTVESHPDDISARVSGQYSCRLRGADLSPLGAGAETVLAEQRDGRLTWQLISLRKTAQGDLDATVRVINDGDKAFSLYGNAVVNELIQTPDLLRVSAEPHSDVYMNFTLTDHVKENDLLSVSGSSSYYFLGLEHLLEQYGVEQVKSLKLCMSVGSEEHIILFRLPEPLPFATQDDVIQARAAVPPGESRLLLDGEISVNVDRILVADNGAAVRMTLKNNSSRDIQLEIDDKNMNGRSIWTSNDSCFLGAGASSVVCVSFRPWSDDLKNFKRVADLGMTFRYEDFTTNRGYIRMNSPVEMGKQGGAYLSYYDFTTEPTEYTRPTGTRILPEKATVDECEVSMSFSFSNRDDFAPEDVTFNTQDMEILFTVTNHAGERYDYKFSEVILNDSRYLGSTANCFCSIVEAGETKEGKIKLGRNAMTNLEEITSVTVTMRSEPGGVYSNGTDHTLRFEVSDCDISRMIQTVGYPLCEATRDGQTWRLYSLEIQKNGDLGGLISVKNETDERMGDNYTSVLAEGVETLGYVNAELPARTEYFTDFSFSNSISVMYAVKAENAEIPNPYITQVLQQLGITEVRTLNLVGMDYKGNITTSVPLRLPNPLRLPAAEGKETLLKNGVLLKGNVSAEISHLLTADDSIVLTLLLKNATAVPAHLALIAPAVDGRTVSGLVSFDIAPHATQIEQVKLSCEDALSPGEKYKELTFALQVDGELYDGASIRPKQAAMGDVRLLSARELTVKEAKLRTMPAVYEKITTPNPEKVVSIQLEAPVNRQKAEKFDYGYAILCRTGKTDLTNKAGEKVEHPCLWESARIPLSLNNGRLLAPFSGLVVGGGSVHAEEVPQKGGTAVIQFDVLIFTNDDPLPEKLPEGTDPFALGRGIRAHYEWTLKYGKKIEATNPKCRMTDVATGKNVDPKEVTADKISAVCSGYRVRITDDPSLSYDTYTSWAAGRPSALTLSPPNTGKNEYRVIYEIHYKDGTMEELEGYY